MKIVIVIPLRVTNTDVRSFDISGTILFAETLGGGIRLQPLFEILTMVELFSNLQSSHFRYGKKLLESVQSSNNEWID